MAANEGELVAMMDRLTRIYSGGRLGGRRMGPGTIVVERIEGTPEFPSLVLPNLAHIADGIDVGAAVAIVGSMPLEVALAEWMEPQATHEGDRFMARIEEAVAARHARRISEDEFKAKRAALWDEAERAGVAVEIGWRLRKKLGVRTREAPTATSLPAISAHVMPEFRYLLELNLRQIPQDAHGSVISRWVRPPHDHIEAGQGAWQNGPRSTDARRTMRRRHGRTGRARRYRHPFASKSPMPMCETHCMLLRKAVSPYQPPSTW